MLSWEDGTPCKNFYQGCVENLFPWPTSDRAQPATLTNWCALCSRGAPCPLWALTRHCRVCLSSKCPSVILCHLQWPADREWGNFCCGLVYSWESGQPAQVGDGNYSAQHWHHLDENRNELQQPMGWTWRGLAACEPWVVTLHCHLGCSNGIILWLGHWEGEGIVSYSCGVRIHGKTFRVCLQMPEAVLTVFHIQARKYWPGPLANSKLVLELM